MPTSNAPHPSSEQEPFPDWLDKYRRFGLFGLALGTLLAAAALFTNSVPDPSFLWASLPSAAHLPFTQLRIENPDGRLKPGMPVDVLFKD